MSSTPRRTGWNGFGLDVGAGARGDRLGGRVGLLRGEPALLDRERDRVARRPHRVGAVDLAVTVAADEPALRRSGAPRSARPDRARQRDDALRVERPRPGSTTACRRRRAMTSASVSTMMPAASRSSRSARRAGRAEDRQRRVLGRVDRDLDVVVAHAARLPGGHQRELVGRQRPRDADRDDERDALGVALLEVAQQAAEDLGVGLRRPGQHRAGARARCAAPIATTSAS